MFLDDDIEATTLISMEKFYVEWEIAIWKDGEPVFYHQCDPTEQKVHFLIGKSTLGDTITLLPYIEEFRRHFQCEVSLTVAEQFHEIVRLYLPNVRLRRGLPPDCYACIYMFAFMNLPICGADSRTMPLELYGRSLLANANLPRPSKLLYTSTKPREIPEPYVCIGVQASGNSKCWLNPGGWDEVVEYLKSLGYRVLCIDRDRECSNFGRTVTVPDGAEDFSGKYTLLDRINQLAYADFFIGLSSGLAWLANAVDIPVVMISGITEPWYEFDTPYRIYNPLVCHGCFNDVHIDDRDFLKCHRHKDTERAFECSKQISARQVINAIDRLITDRNLMGGNDIDSSD